MINSAANSDYPKFVADQVLTSDNLNDLFGYLDEQGRLTRANLSGIGIVCGLDVKTATDGSSITITKGVGVTSSGYLVTVPEVTYTKRTTEIFDAVKCEYYNKFVNVADKTQKFDLWQLKQEAESEGTTALTKSFLTDGEKVVLIFVELLEENNKNCDPNSCDDKGAQVTVTFRPLLVEKSSAISLITSTGSNSVTASAFNALPDFAMPRWNVPNSSPVNAIDISNAYQSLLSAGFIANVQSVLSNSWLTFKPVILNEFPTDPFAEFDLVSKFQFLHNGTISLNDSNHIQYYYDLFSDLAAAYEEFCLTGNEIISECCPDGSLFPRHLLLGEAIPLPYEASSAFRHYFIYSPLFQRKELLVELKFLFRRLVLLLESFLLPTVTASKSDDEKIIITPSKLSEDPISAKSIPYYYKPDSSPLALYQNWSFLKLKRNRANQNLSYHASSYAVDDFVKNPLNYDLEPYNFFRLEGIIGKEVAGVLNTIKKRITDFRLPIKVVALATGEPGKGAEDDNCCFLPDLQLQYRLLREELLSCLESNIKYWGSIQKKKDTKGRVIFQIENMPLTYMGYYVPMYIADTAGVKESQPMMMKVAEKAVEKKAKTKEASDKTVMETKGRLILDDIQEISNDTMASIYLDYQKTEIIHMAGLPGPKTRNTVENIQYYVLILIDEMESMASLLDSESIKEFDTDLFNKHVSALNSACGSLGDLLSAYKRTDYLVEKIRVTLEGHAEDINAIADAMPVMSDDDASKIILLLANIENINTFTNDLKKNEGDYAAQQATIKSYYDKLDKDGMMVPIPKNPDPGFVSSHAVMLEKLKACKCNDVMEKLIYLVEKYHSQLDQLRDINNFTVYSQAHPGIQHKAGVTSGGTFIIVYKGPKDISEKILVNTVIADFYLPYNCCSNCNPIEVNFQETPPPENQPPVARPGDNVSIQLPEDSVILDGSSSSDPDGTIKSYQWELQSGTEATIENPEESKTKVTGLSEGTYIFKLTVTDDDGATDSDTVTVIVLPVANIPPNAIAFAEPDSVVLSVDGQGTSQLSGVESNDPDGEIKFYNWSLSSGPTDGMVLKDPDKEQTSVSFTKTGTYVFKLTVTDDDGATDTTTVTITVTREISPPVAVASANPTSIVMIPGQPVTAQLDGSGSSDPNGTIKSFLWTMTATTTGANIVSPSSAKTAVQFSQAGNFSFQLTVTSDTGLSDTASVSVVVTQEIDTVKTCALLENVIADFDKIATADTPENFKLFVVQYIDIREITALFNRMKSSDVVNMPVDAQIKFFIEQKTESQFQKWINDLPSVLLEFPELRTLSLLTFNSLTELAYFISCIQAEDINIAEVKMDGILSTVIELLQSLTPQIANFADEHKKIVSILSSFSNDENTRLKENGEDSKKPLYGEMLSSILEAFKAMNL